VACSLGMADPQLGLILEGCVGKTFHNSCCSSMRRDLNDGPLGDKVPQRCEVEGMGMCDVGKLFVKCVPQPRRPTVGISPATSERAPCAGLR
jgi:hypothetical protein